MAVQYTHTNKEQTMIHFEEGSNDFYITVVEGEIFVQGGKDGHPFPLDFWIPAIQDEAIKALA
jgi:hypothetical protein